MESITTINQRLIDYFGINTSDNRAIWRVVWSDDQLEKRRTNYTPEGLELISPVVREMKKYPYIKERYVLERLVLIPEFQQDELPVAKISYEPMWTFEDAQGFPLPPKWEAIKHIIDCIHLATGKRDRVKYPDPDRGKSPEQLVHEEKQRIDDLQKDLFGNETKEMDKVRLGEGVIVPSKHFGDS